VTKGEARDLLVAAIARKTPRYSKPDDPDAFAATGLAETEIPPDVDLWPPSASVPSWAPGETPPRAANRAAHSAWALVMSTAGNEDGSDALNAREKEGASLSVAGRSSTLRRELPYRSSRSSWFPAGSGW
jgi:hypothetical protein